MFLVIGGYVDSFEIKPKEDVLPKNYTRKNVKFTVEAVNLPNKEKCTEKIKELSDYLSAVWVMPTGSE